MKERIWEHKKLYVDFLEILPASAPGLTSRYMIEVGGERATIRVICFVAPNDQLVIADVVPMLKSLYVAELSALVMVLWNNDGEIIEGIKKVMG